MRFREGGQAVIEYLKDYLQDWHTKDEILKQLGGEISERAFRQQKKKWNKLYKEHKVSQFLAHSTKKGYKLTTVSEEIIESENDFMKRGKNDLYEAYSIRKARRENNNYSFDDFINDFMEEQKSPMLEHQTVS